MNTEKSDNCGGPVVIGEIAAAVAHEMRTPLTAIKTSVYFLQIAGVAEGHDPKVAEHISLISEKTDLCTRMMMNMQSVVQPARPVRKELRIEELLTEILSVLLTKMKIRTNFQKDLPPVLADPFQIRQVFVNVIRNAVEAIDAGGTLAITTKASDGSVLVVFEDTGRGIATEDLEKIFIPLFSTTPHKIGLGLVVCKKFVEAHGGTISVKSELQKGTVVEIKLPLK